jgi:hypothetical protein
VVAGVRHDHLTQPRKSEAPGAYGLHARAGHPEKTTEGVSVMHARTSIPPAPTVEPGESTTTPPATPVTPDPLPAGSGATNPIGGLCGTCFAPVDADDGYCGDRCTTLAQALAALGGMGTPIAATLPEPPPFDLDVTFRPWFADGELDARLALAVEHAGAVA